MSRHPDWIFHQQMTWLETWDPRTKIVFTLLIVASLIICQNIGLRLVFITAILLLWSLSKLGWKLLGLLFLSLLFLFLSTMIYHTLILASPAQDVVQLGPLSLNRQGIIVGASMLLQIAGVVMLLSLLVRTTSPIMLAEGLELLLSPLKKLRFPIHEAAMMFMLTMRFLPLLAGEFEKIQQSQIARGAGFHRGTLRERAKGIIPMLLPIFVQSILRAEELAVAMDSRCYQGGHGRTSLRSYRLTAQDMSIIGFSVCALAAAIALRIK